MRIVHISLRANYARGGETRNEKARDLPVLLILDADKILSADWVLRVPDSQP